MFKVIYRAWLLFAVRLLEVEHDTLSDAFAATSDPWRRFGIRAALEVNGRELAAARARYTATFPPGRRFVWATA